MQGWFDLSFLSITRFCVLQHIYPILHPVIATKRKDRHEAIPAFHIHITTQL
jgi:hypothetical protein